jgi:hypothetical protein
LEVWIALVVLALLLVVLAVLIPVRLSLNLQGRGDPSGLWILAGGAQLGPFALSGAAGRDVPSVMQAHILGRRVWPRPAGPSKRESSPEQRPGKQRSRRRLDPLDFALFLVQERRRVRVDRLDVDLEYSFADVALTGKMMGAIFMLSAVLPPRIVVRQRSSWESVDKASLALSGSLRVFLVLLLLDVLSYRRKTTKRAPRRASSPKPRDRHEQ